MNRLIIYSSILCVSLIQGLSAQVQTGSLPKTGFEQSIHDVVFAIPILAWYGIPANETTVARYQELKEAGITYHFTGFPNADAMQKALVSLLERGENSFLVVVNKDFLNSINLTFYGDESVKKVLKDGTIVPASAYESSMELDPGDAAIYMFPKTLK